MMREIAEHPAQGISELAVGLGGTLQDSGPETDVARVVRRRHPQAQNVGARGAHELLRREGIATRLRHLLLSLLVEDEAVREHYVEGRAAARATALQQRGLEPASMLVGALEVHDAILAAIDLTLDAGQLRKSLWIFQREGMRGAGVE